MLTRSGKFTPSKRPYAFTDVPGSDRMEAVWFGRKNGRLIVTTGDYHVWAQHFEGGRIVGLDLSLPLDERLAHADTRYGGNWHHQWNGERLLSEPRHLLDPAGSSEMAHRLEKILKAAPEVPAGMEGWFYRN